MGSGQHPGRLGGPGAQSLRVTQAAAEVGGWGRERAPGDSGVSQPEGLLRLQLWERQRRGGHRDGAELAGRGERG